MAKKVYEQKEKRERRIYSKTELEQFDRVLSKYMVEREVVQPDGTKKMALCHDWDTIYIRAGVKVRPPASGKLVYPLSVVHIITPDGSDQFPIQEFENKVEQWKYWRDGIEYGEVRRLEQLDLSPEAQKSQKDFEDF